MMMLIIGKKIVLLLRSFGVEAAQSISRIAWVGLSGVNVAVECFVFSTMAYHVQILLFQQVHC